MRRRKRKLWREWVRKDTAERRRRETELERDTVSTKINILPIMDIYLLCAEGGRGKKYCEWGASCCIMPSIYFIQNSQYISKYCMRLYNLI